MVFKYFFYFISWFNKKVDILGGTDEYCYYAASALVGMTMSVGLYAVVNCFIIFTQSSGTYRVVSTVMDILCIIMSLLSFVFFRHNGRWDKIYREVQYSSSFQKYRYGFYCFVYVMLSYGLWFLSNDVIRVLKTGDGSSVAVKIVDLLGLTSW
jgi:hypothetical protein